MPPSPMPTDGATGADRPGCAASVDGLRFLATQPVLLLSFAIDIVAMVLAMPRALFPEVAAGAVRRRRGGRLAVQRDRASARWSAGLTSGWIGRVRRQGVALVVAVVGWGLAVGAPGWPGSSGWWCCCSRWAARPTWSARSTGSRSCRRTRRTGCAAGCRACSPPWWPAGRAWATCGPAPTADVVGPTVVLGRRRHRGGRAWRSCWPCAFPALLRYTPRTGATRTAAPSPVVGRRWHGMDSAGRHPGTQWTIAADGHEAVLVEVGGGLRDYRRRRRRTSSTATPRTSSAPARAGQVLAPVAEPDPRRAATRSTGSAYQLALTEPARHNAIHGLVNWVALAAGRAGRRTR